jgi:hypothetical protein
MVTNGVAAAFCNPWKFQIERIKEGDIVFLYENGVGIVGMEIAPREVEKVEYDGVAEDAYRKKLVDYRRVKPLNARDIKKVIGSNLIFLRTLFKCPRVWQQDTGEHAGIVGSRQCPRHEKRSIRFVCRNALQRRPERGPERP